MCPSEADNLSISGLHVHSLPSACLPCERVILDSGELPMCSNYDETSFMGFLSIQILGYKAAKPSTYTTTS